MIFSSRTIPGNEKAVGAVINGLVAQNVEVITDRTHLVHVSGHPRVEEMEEMLGWVKPMILVPVHGEELHLYEHEQIGRRLGIKRVLRCRNGDVLKLAPNAPEIIDEIPTGRLYKDGHLLIPADGKTISERRKLSFAGMVFVAIVLTEKGILAADPEIDLMGIPEKGRNGSDMNEIAYDAVMTTIETLPKPRRRDPDSIAESVRRAVRAALAAQWGKKPACHVHVLVV